MYSLKKQLFSAWAPFMVLISWVNAFDDTERAKTYLKIGLDLTPNSNGMPSLKIRRFEEDDEPIRRLAVSKPSIRADSISDSEENDKVSLKKSPNKEGKPPIRQSNEDDSSAEYSGIRSTKGLRTNDFEPDGNGKVHVRPSEDSDDSDGNVDTLIRHHPGYANGQNLIQQQIALHFEAYELNHITTVTTEATWTPRLPVQKNVS